MIWNKVASADAYGELTVKAFASLIGISADKLLQQLTEAGVLANGKEYIVSPSDKLKLLGFLRRHSQTSSPLAPDRKFVIRRKRTYVKATESESTKAPDAHLSALAESKTNEPPRIANNLISSRVIYLDAWVRARETNHQAKKIGTSNYLKMPYFEFLLLTELARLTFGGQDATYLKMLENLPLKSPPPVSVDISMETWNSIGNWSIEEAMRLLRNEFERIESEP